MVLQVDMNAIMGKHRKEAALRTTETTMRGNYIITDKYCDGVQKLRTIENVLNGNKKTEFFDNGQMYGINYNYTSGGDTCTLALGRRNPKQKMKPSFFKGHYITIDGDCYASLNDRGLSKVMSKEVVHPKELKYVIPMIKEVIVNFSKILKV